MSENLSEVILLQPANGCIGVWSLTVTWQRWRPHHWIRHPKIPCHTQTSCAIFYRTGVIGDRSLGIHCGNRIFDLFGSCPWPWPHDLPGRYSGCANMNFLYIKAFETYRLTDRQVTRGHFQSRDKDGGHTIQSAVVENTMRRPYATRKTDGSMFYDDLHIWSVLHGVYITDANNELPYVIYVKVFKSYRLTVRVY